MGEVGLGINAIPFLIVIGLFLGMMLALMVGRYLGRRHPPDEMASARTRLTAVEAAIFGLLGLLVAFTFSGASSRYDLRRQMTVDESNAIGTAYLRLDLLPAQAQPALREKFRRYLEARIAAYRLLPDIEASYKQVAVATSLQPEIWADAIAALRESPPQATVVMIPALNQMFNLATSKAILSLSHIPLPILIMLVVLGVACALLAGYVMAGISTRFMRVHMITFALITTITVYVILDLDYPRFGLIQLDFVDKAMLDLLARMK